MSKHLFVFSVRPVQTYIEQARRTQDMYAGSYLLSRLCRIAIDTLNASGATILFPSAAEGQSLPNRCIAEIEPPAGQDESAVLKALGEKVEKTVQKTFLDIAENTIGVVLKGEDIDWQTQVKNFLWLDWLCVPYQENDYAAMYDRMDRVFYGLKQSHAFGQNPEQGRKCSLCGERNVKVYARLEGEANRSRDSLIDGKLFTSDVLILNASKDRHLPDSYIQPGEGLCAVCAMKRNTEQAFTDDKNLYDRGFPSTSHVALFDAIHALPKAERPGYTDYDAEVVLTLKHSPDRAKEEAESAQSFQRAEQIFDTLRRHDISFGPYYAVVHFDGDFMGKWLSGEFLQPGADLLAFHRNLSKQLGEFAEEARKYLQPPRGKCVYAGGDDFLGLVNLKNLFDILKTLRSDFDRLVNVPLFDEQGFSLRDDAPRLSFSAGVVAAHYKTPLREALKWARRMEKQAKQHDSEYKDMFALAALKHSGEVHQTLFKWCKRKGSDNELWTTDLLQTLVTVLLEKQVSGKLLVNLDDEFRRLMNPDGTKLFRKKILAPEAIRLARRACQVEGPEKEETVQRVVQALMQLFDSSLHSFENFLQALEVVNFFTRRGSV